MNESDYQSFDGHGQIRKKNREWEKKKIFLKIVDHMRPEREHSRTFAFHAADPGLTWSPVADRSNI